LPPILDDAPRLRSLLEQAMRRRKLLRSWEGVAWGGLVGFLLATGLKLYERLFWPDWSNSLTLGLVFGVVGIGLALGAILPLLFIRRDPVRAALDIESQYSLKERLSSILFLNRAGEHFDPEAAEALVRDGERCAPQVDVSKAMPFHRPRAAMPAMLTGLVFLGCFVIPQLDLFGAEDDRQQVQAEKKRVEDAKKRHKKKIEQIKQRAEQEKVNPQTRKLLEKMIQRQKLDRKDRKKGQGQTLAKRRELSDLQKMKKKASGLRNRAEMKSLEQFLRKVQNAGKKMESQEGKKVAKSLSEGDLEAASNAMKQLAKKMEQALSQGGFEGAEFQKLARDLKGLQSKLGGLPSVDKKLAELLSKMDTGDMGDLSKMMQGAAMDLDQLARLMKEAQMLDQAVQEIEFTEDELAQMPQEWPDEPPGELCENCKKGLPGL